MSGTTRDRLTQVDDTSDRAVYYDDIHGTYHTWCDATDYEPVSTGVVMTVSSVLDIDPVDLEALSKHVNPDALNAIVAHWDDSEFRTPEGSITFPFARCTITVNADGEIVIDPD